MEQYLQPKEEKQNAASSPAIIDVAPHAEQTTHPTARGAEAREIVLAQLQEQAQQQKRRHKRWMIVYGIGCGLYLLMTLGLSPALSIVPIITLPLVLAIPARSLPRKGLRRDGARRHPAWRSSMTSRPSGR